MKLEIVKILYLFFTLNIVGIVVIRYAQLAKCLDVQRLPVIFTIFSIALYLPTLLSGVINKLSGIYVYSFTIFFCICLLYVVRNHKITVSCVQNDSSPFVIKLSDLPLIGVGLILLAPLLTLLYDLPLSLTDKNIWLPWDTVSYHLPAMIEYLQNKSLWSIDGPYQSYSFAFELIANYGNLWFPSHLGLIFGNILGVLYLFISVYYLLTILLKTRCISDHYSIVSIFILAIGLWVLIFKNKIFSIGKNDIFQTACILSSFGFILDFIFSQSNSTIRKIFIIIIASCSTGLAIATKPTALAYLPFFSILILYSDKLKKLNSSFLNFKNFSFKYFSLFIVITYTVGGFFLTRNLVEFKTINPLSGAWNLSLIANISNVALYEIKIGGLVFIFSIISVFFWIRPLLSCEQKSSKRMIFVFICFHLICVLAFSVTPHAIFHHTTDWTTWKLRLGLPLFTTMVLSTTILFVYFYEIIQKRKKNISYLISFTLISIFLIFILNGYRYPLAGLPHYEVIKNHPRTSAYKWIQGLSDPVKIYSAGLRPYGLYGTDWRNKVFYDLHTAPLVPTEKGKKRIFAVIKQFKPDFIIISVDPHPYSNGNKKPEIVTWLESKTYIFSEEFSDSSVSIFRVKDDAESILEEELDYQTLPKVKRQG